MWLQLTEMNATFWDSARSPRKSGEKLWNETMHFTNDLVNNVCPSLWGASSWNHRLKHWFGLGGTLNMLKCHCQERQGGDEHLLGLVLDCVSALRSSWLPWGHQGSSVVLIMALATGAFQFFRLHLKLGNSSDRAACAQLHISHHLG